MSRPYVLIGCEESQILTLAFRAAGFNAFSCDIQPTRGNPDFHYQQCIKKTLPLRDWDLVVLHPDCTALSLSGNRWYGKGMPLNHLRVSAIEWTCDLFERAKNHAYRVALENPKSVIFQYLNAPSFSLQPYEHGHGETKETRFALHNLPSVPPSNIVEGRENRIWKMPPSLHRKRDRSETFPGVAKALVNAWGTLL